MRKFQDVLIKIFVYYVIYLISAGKCQEVSSIFKNNYEKIFDEIFDSSEDITTTTEKITESGIQDICDDNVLMSRNNNCVSKEIKDNEIATYDKCGVRNEIGITSKLTSGTSATLYEFPWLVAIYFNSSVTSQSFYAAAGSLIHPKIVLTVAHRSLHPAEAFVVRAGESNLDVPVNNLYPYQNRNVEKIIHHRNFNQRKLHNDIAMLILDQPFILSPNIRTICLPPLRSNFDQKLCTVAAWGIGENKFEGGISKLDLSIEPNIKCQNSLRRASGRNSFILDESFVCAGSSSADASIGDGGSPLTCPIENSQEYYLVGMVAAGIGRKNANAPGVYTNIPYLRSWIDEMVVKETLTVNYYTHNLA